MTPETMRQACDIQTELDHLEVSINTVDKYYPNIYKVPDDMFNRHREEIRAELNARHAELLKQRAQL